MGAKATIRNVGYVFVMYDIGENRVNKVFKICKKYLEHHQNSVFRGVITKSQLMKLENEIKKVIDESYDRVTIIKLRDGYAFEEVSFGVKKGNNMII